MRTLLLVITLCFSTFSWASLLTLGEGFYATNHNGQEVSVHADTIALSEGRQVIVLRYANPYIFFKEFHEVIVSAPRYLVFNASGTQPYRIAAELPTELDDAKDFADAPVLTLMQGDQVIPHQLYSETELQALLAMKLP